MTAGSPRQFELPIEEFRGIYAIGIGGTTATPLSADAFVDADQRVPLRRVGFLTDGDTLLVDQDGAYLMYLSLSISVWLALPLAALAGALLVRVFIIFHDCGHGSFFRSRLANDAAGFVAGVLTFTPYYHWRWEHAQHHATTGDLDRRGTGDVWTMTARGRGVEAR